MDTVVRVVAGTLLVAALVLFFLALVASVVWRRRDVTAREILVAGQYAVAHPERFVTEDRVGTIRGLFFAVIALIAIAGGILIVSRL